MLGWGSLSYGGGYPEKLREVSVTIVSDSVCQAAVNDQGWTVSLNLEYSFAGLRPMSSPPFHNFMLNCKLQMSV